MVTEMARPRPIEGPLEKEFWGYVRQHELRVQKCTQCGRLRYPTANVCPDCLGFDYEWHQLNESGTVLSWVRFHRKYFPDLPTPYEVVLVEMDDGPLMMANMLDQPVDGIKIGMRVEVAYEPVDDEWTIFQFRPLK